MQVAQALEHWQHHKVDGARLRQHSAVVVHELLQVAATGPVHDDERDALPCGRQAAALGSRPLQLLHERREELQHMFVRACRVQPNLARQLHARDVVELVDRIELERDHAARQLALGLVHVGRVAAEDGRGGRVRGGCRTGVGRLQGGCGAVTGR
eukprot:267420-Chlamydomonas_euryale.AAC.1